MSLYPYSIKNYNPNDFEEFVEFCKEINSFGQEENDLTSSILEKKLRRPHYSPSQDLFLAKLNKKIVGFLNMTPELRIGRIILSGFIHPGHRRLGLAKEMLGCVLKRASDVKAKVVHVCLSESNIAAKALMRKFDFTPVRCFLKLEINLSEVIKETTSLLSVEIGQFKPGEETQLTSIQNKCFTGTWGFCPNTVEEIRYYLDLTESRLKDVIAARLRKDKSIIGYCWTIMLGKNHKVFSRKKGRIHMFGIDPDYQGKGLGKILLLSGLYYLREKGAGVVELIVDKENAVAYSLYRSLGFKTTSSSFWYEKRL